ncbi:hypothetical protein Plhal304r1_c007g0028061 [Plasmopara halstedii]
MISLTTGRLREIEEVIWTSIEFIRYYRDSLSLRECKALSDSFLE